MDYNKYYSLDHKESWRTPLEPIDWETGMVDMTNGEYEYERLVRVKYKSIKNPSIFLTCGLFFFHESVFEGFEKAGITGWGTFPVEIVKKGKQKERIEGYHGLKIYGRCSERDEERSIVGHKLAPYAYSPVLKGTYFNNDEWDGSDFFMFPDKGHVFVTQKVKDFFEKEIIKEAEFKPLTDMTYDGKPLKRKVYEEIENGTYNGDYLRYLEVATIYYGSNNRPRYEDAMNDKEFKELWDICNTKENYLNNDFIEKIMRRFPDDEATIRRFTIVESIPIGKYFSRTKKTINTKKLATRYSNFVHLK